MQVIKVELTEDQKAQARVEIESGLQQIQKERDEQDLELSWERNPSMYDGTFERKPGIWSGAAQYHINQLMVAVDITALKAKKQTLGAKPLIILEPDEDGIPSADLRDHEDWLDFKMRREVEVSKLYGALYRNTAIQGTGILKNPWDKQVEEFPFIETYQPKDIEKYKTESLKQGIGEEEVMKNLTLLLSGQPVNLERVDKIVRYDSPRPYQIPLVDLYVRPTIRDIYRQRVIAEKRTLNWMDIQRELKTKYYTQAEVDEMTQHRGDKFTEENYTHFECILYSDLQKKGDYKRYIITEDDESKTIMRCIMFPYWHALMYYIPYYIIPRDDSFYGYGLGDRSRESNEMVDRVWNSIINMADLHMNPPKEVEGTVKIPSDAGPGSLYYATAGGKIKNMEITPFSNEHYNLLSMGIRLDEMVSGVTSGMSGKESPSDPRAPMGKTAMLMSAGNERIDDYIKELQEGNSQLAEQVDKLYMQFKPGDLYYFSGGQSKKLNVAEEIRSKKLRYVPHGSEMSLNKAYELAMLQEFMGFVGNFPEVIQDPVKRNILLAAFIDAMGGVIEKHKKELIPDLQINPILQQLSLLPPERLQQLSEMKLGEVMETMGEMMMPQGGGEKAPAGGKA